jgi:endonuclease/exonuclease/phosphatase family metal-dependent hydrolase
MRVATWNLLHGQSIPPTSASEEGNLAAIGEFISASAIDLIGVQEVDGEQERSGMHSQVAVLAEQLGVTSGNYAFARTVIGTPGFSWRHVRKDEAVINPSDAEPSYGIGLMSKIPVIAWHTLNLRRSLIGLPLIVPGGTDGKSIRFMYVKDEPRIALAAELENGYTVAVTHLSFVPLVNLWQLIRVKRWLAAIGKDPSKLILMGDLNLPFNIPIRPRFASKWISLNPQKSYPSWKPAVKFDYILTKKSVQSAATNAARTDIDLPASGFSDHLPLAVDI